MLRSERGLDTSLSYMQGADLQGRAKKAVHRVWAAAILQEPLSRCQLSLSCRKVPAKSTVSPASCPCIRVGSVLWALTSSSYRSKPGINSAQGVSLCQPSASTICREVVRALQGCPLVIVAALRVKHLHIPVADSMHALMQRQSWPLHYAIMSKPSRYNITQCCHVATPTS